MQITNARHKFDLFRREIILVALLLVGFMSVGQEKIKENLADYDEQWIHFGFLMGIHTSHYQTEYAPIFTTPTMDSVHSIVPGNQGGFKLGFVVNMFMFQYLDFRILPTVGFYEYDLTYRYVDESTLRELKDATMMELPILLKYKSVRRGNVAMYLVGGFNPQWEAAGKGDEIISGDVLELKNFNFAVDLGVGFDMYYPLFKFSPELRYSWGRRNLLPDSKNSLSLNFDRIVTHNLGLFITFEGGPSYLKRRKKQK
ncbi:MAG: PorT family protein [Cyclobacteriaceae bacterium]